MVIENILKNLNKSLGIALKTSTKLGNEIVNNKDKINEMDKCGINKLRCNDSNVVYITKTYRPFRKRIKEHMASMKNNDKKCKPPYWQNTHFWHEKEFLYITSDNKLLLTLEALEIFNKIKNHNFLTLNQQNKTI